MATAHATISQSKGSSGADVSEWQNLLTNAGYPTPVTGVFDAATDASTRAWQGAKGLDADAVVGPASWAKMTGQAAPAPADPNAKFGRDVLQNIWLEVTGENPSLAELQIAGAQAKLESNYGKSPYQLLDHASTPSNRIVLESSGVINNWGAVQSSEGFLATDSGPGHITADNPYGWYEHHYKVYATPEEGAKSMLEHLTLKRPTSWALMKTGDIDAWAQQMWAGVLPNGQLNRDPLPPIGSPPGTKGSLGYFEQKPASRALGIEKNIAGIASALGEPVAARRGGPMEPPVDGGGGGGGGGGGDIIPALVDTPAKKGIAAIFLAAVGYAVWRFWIRRR